jgi:hypothetical protein
MTKRVIRSKDRTIFEKLIINRFNGWRSLAINDEVLLK